MGDCGTSDRTSVDENDMQMSAFYSTLHDLKSECVGESRFCEMILLFIIFVPSCCVDVLTNGHLVAIPS